MTPSAAAAPLLARALAEPAAEHDAVAERILDAALEQFQAFGLRRTSVEDVARRAGVARVTVYRRHAGKDALVEAVLLRECRRVIAEVDAAVMPAPTVDDRLVEGFAAMLSAARNHPLIGRLLDTDPDVLLPYLTVHAGPGIAIAREFLAERIRQAQAQGHAPAGDAGAIAEMIVRLTLSFVLTPDSAIALDDAGARDFARRHVAPLVTGAAAD